MDLGGCEMTKDEAVVLLCEHFSEGMVRTIVDAIAKDESLQLALEIKDKPVGWIDNKGNMILRKPRLDLGADYERGFIDGMQYQMQSSVDKAVNAMGKREWVGLIKEEQSFLYNQVKQIVDGKPFWVKFADAIEAKLKERNI
jgi:hypothetical protein